MTKVKGRKGHNEEIINDRIMSSCQTVGVVEANRGALSTTLSTQSTTLTCRICQDGNSLEPLLNACDCSGSIGLVHALCLEKWLSQSARESCELCQYEFKTVKRVKNFHQFLCRPDLPLLEKHYILADTACFVVLTPLGLASSYLCLRGANQYYNNDDFWAGFALVLLSTFLTLLYVFWVTIAIRYHYRSFKEWQKESVEVNIVFSDHQHINVAPKISDLTNNNNNYISNNNNNNDSRNTSDAGTKDTFQNPVVSVRTATEDIRTEHEEYGESEIMIKSYSEGQGGVQLFSRKRSIGQDLVNDMSTDSLLSTKV